MVFDDVDFAYNTGPAVVKGLSLEIEAYNTWASSARPGQARVRSVKLLLAFYDVTQGCITLDGVDLRNLHMADLRRWVDQDVFLFHGTVRENITYGRSSMLSSTILCGRRRSLKRTTSSCDGYDTIVGERGQKLSGGQRQRISIARAILKNRVSLDEATSSVR